MRPRFARFVVLAPAGAVLAGTVLAGCVSPGFEKASATASELQATANELVEARTQVDTTLGVLTKLVAEPSADLRLQFQTYEKEVDRLGEQAARVDRQAAQTSAKGQAYFDAWDREIVTIQSPEIRARSVARRQEVSQSFEQIQSSFQAVREAYKPLGTTLTDMRTALGTDLTPGGVASLRDLVDRANEQSGSLRRALDEVISRMRDLASKMTPAAAPQ